MTRVAELIDLGIRAYTRGQLAEAERCWNEALAAEPTNARARSYLDVLLGRKEAGVGAEAAQPPSARPRAEVEPRPTGGQAPERQEAAEEPIPLPSPSMASRPPAPPPAPADRGPVPLPSPSGPQRAAVAPHMTLPWTAAGSPSPHDPTAIDAGPAPVAAPDAPPEEVPAVAAPPPSGIAPSAPEALLAAERPAEVRPDRSTLNDYAPSPWDEGPALAPAVVLAEGEGLDLATVADQSDLRPLVPDQDPIPQVFSTAAPRNAIEVWMEGARELFSLGDFSGSLEMLEKILKVDPSHEEARRYLKENESTLIAMYESKLGSRDCVPRLAINPEEVMWLNLDHRAGFLLAQVDGAVSYEDLFALSGLPRLDTARILATLLQEGVILSS